MLSYSITLSIAHFGHSRCIILHEDEHVLLLVKSGEGNINS